MIDHESLCLAKTTKIRLIDSYTINWMWSWPEPASRSSKPKIRPSLCSERYASHLQVGCAGWSSVMPQECDWAKDHSPLNLGFTRQRVPQQHCLLLLWQARAGIHWLLFAVLLRMLKCLSATIIFCCCAASSPAPPNCFWCREASSVCRVGYYSYYWIPLCL